MTATREIIYFTHMPKCGGQSFKAGLEQAYGDRAHFIYLIPIPILFRKRVHLRLWRIRNIAKPIKIPENTRIVYGHVCFDDLPKLHNTTIMHGAFFREPVEWFGSFYHYSRRKYPKEFSAKPIDIIKKFKLSSAFRQHLGSVGVEDLKFVGLQEQYKTSLGLFEKTFGEKIPHIHKNITKSIQSSNVNKSKYRNIFESQNMLEEIEEAMQENTKIYEAAVERHNLLVEFYRV